MKKIINILSIIVIAGLFANLQAQCVQCDGNNSVEGTYSSAMGMSNTTTANSTAAFAGGYGSIADGDFAFAFGGYATAQGNNTLAIGRYVTAGVDNAMVIGRGSSTTHRLVNNIPNSLMIGFNSGMPTFFVKAEGVNTVGKVGIGTTNPPEILTVKGNILCVEIKVIENVPESDFVFEEDYPLMSIKELEIYVKENHHLPEIPSSEEFKANGYNMNDMDDLLLRKVEELTLYIIASDKKMREMEKYIKALEEKTSSK